MNEHQEKFLSLLQNGEKAIVMLAPSFPIDFPHPQIIGMLKKLGVDKVTELTFGARMTNHWYKKYIEENPNQKYYITSPCPTIVATVEKGYPELTKYLIPYTSPMHSMAKICRKNFPEHKIVFISPCQAKRLLELSKYPGIVDVVITFRELKEIFDNKGVKPEEMVNGYAFDSFVTEVNKIYPMSGGLSQTARISGLFKPEEILVVDGVQDVAKALSSMRDGTCKYKFIDVLNCPGGCIGGPDIFNKGLTHEEKDAIILAYREKCLKDNQDGIEAPREYETGIDFKVGL